MISGDVDVLPPGSERGKESEVISTIGPISISERKKLLSSTELFLHSGLGQAQTGKRALWSLKACIEPSSIGKKYITSSTLCLSVTTI